MTFVAIVARNAVAIVKSAQDVLATRTRHAEQKDDEENELRYSLR